MLPTPTKPTWNPTSGVARHAPRKTLRPTVDDRSRPWIGEEAKPPPAARGAGHSVVNLGVPRATGSSGAAGGKTARWVRQVSGQTHENRSLYSGNPRGRGSAS